MRNILTAKSVYLATASAAFTATMLLSGTAPVSAHAAHGAHTKTTLSAQVKSHDDDRGRGTAYSNHESSSRQDAHREQAKKDCPPKQSEPAAHGQEHKEKEQKKVCPPKAQPAPAKKTCPPKAQPEHSHKERDCDRKKPAPAVAGSSTTTPSESGKGGGYILAAHTDVPAQAQPAVLANTGANLLGTTSGAAVLMLSAVAVALFRRRKPATVAVTPVVFSATI